MRSERSRIGPRQRVARAYKSIGCAIQVFAPESIALHWLLWWRDCSTKLRRDPDFEAETTTSRAAEPQLLAD